MADYDYTLNPYSGCTFGCSYCYAAFFARDKDLQERWGEWVTVKENALQSLRRMRTPLTGKSIYMSSVTDPYQPVERELRLVRELLEDLVPRQPRLVVQTRSPLVTRDLDLYGRLERVRVHMTITTDSEDVRRAYEPHCPGNGQRLDAITEVAASGVSAAITMTPLLPVEDAEAFAQRLLATGVQRFVVQPFHAERGRFVAGTRDAAAAITSRLGWDNEAYRRTVARLRAVLPNLEEGKDGFAPP
jgi:DNA repair photolyase